jgi:DNA modification methylase
MRVEIGRSRGQIGTGRWKAAPRIIGKDMTKKRSPDPALSHKKLSELTADARNANKGTARGAAMIRASLRDYGAGRSVLLDRNGAIIAGNKTVENAGALGHKDVIVVQTDGSQLVAVQRTDLDLADPKARQLAIADNRSSEVSLDWSVDALKALSGDGVDLGPFWSKDELEKLWPQNADLLTDEDEVPPVPAEPTSKLGDLWILGEHWLLCGDSTVEANVERLMGGQKADCVFTSPPYAVGIEYAEYKDTIENLRVLLPAAAKVWKSLLVQGGFAVVNFGDVLSGKELSGSRTPCEYPMALEHFPVFRNAGYVLWSRRVWCKPSAAVGSSRHCIGTNRAASNFEHVWTWKLPGKPPVNDQISGVWPSQAGWFDSTHDNHLGVGLDVHGAGMPVVVAQRSVVWHSRSGQIVHEPFAGTGTTLIACEKTGRKCFMMELSPAYCDVIVTRWQNATGKKAVLDGG